MKLRNKKTGDIVDAWLFYDSSETINIKFASNAEVKMVVFEYNSLAELNEEWEDYKLAEPLIKDEKIRNLVKVWAELNKVDKVSHIVYEGSSLIFKDHEFNEFLLDFTFTIPNLYNGITYTITELCGNES